MRLSDLPIELQLSIAECLSPRSCFYFACTSSEHFHMCASLVTRHKQLSERYNMVDAGAHNAERLIWDVTKEVIEEPHRAKYIKDISLPGNRQLNSEAEHNESPIMFMSSATPQLPEVFVQDYIAAVKKDWILNRVLEEHTYESHLYGTLWNMEKTIRSGADEPILAILLSRAWKLRTLRFTDAGLSAHEMLQMVKNVAMAYGEPARSLSLPFQKLTYVAIAHYDSEGACDPSWAKFFLAIPSLRGLAAHMMGGVLDGNDYAGSLLQSNVKSIFFQYSYFHPEAVEDLLSGTKALQSFAYDNGGGVVNDEGCFAPRRVIRALVEHAGHSLEKLVLEGDENGLDDDEIDRVSLQGFQKLKVLHCSWSTIFHDLDNDKEDDDAELPEGGFYTEQSRERGDLETRFPRSLEFLHLEGNAPEDADWRALITILREADRYLPALKQIWVGGDGRPKEELLTVVNERNIVYGKVLRMDYHPLGKLLDGQGYT